MTVGVLAAFEPLYARMGLLGWSAPDVDRMEVWLVTRFLGDDDAGFDPVIRGARDGLRLSTDPKAGESGPPKSRLSRMRSRLGRPSQVHRGEAAK